MKVETVVRRGDRDIPVGHRVQVRAPEKAEYDPEKQNGVSLI